RIPRLRAQADSKSVGQQKMSLAPTMISVLVLYSPAVKKLWGGQSGAELVIDQIVRETNAAYAASKVQQTIVAAKSEIHIIESGSLDADLKWLEGSADAAALRTKNKSDV